MRPVESPPHEGISIAVYDHYSVIDERRWIDSDGKTLELAHVDPGAALASLVIEADGVRVGRCTRAHIPHVGKGPDQLDSIVRCAIDAAPGRHLVRVLYVSATLSYRAEHDVAVIAPDRARLASRFVLATPAWGERADVVLYDGVPGGTHPPREIARGQVALDGAFAVLGAPPRDVPAQLRRVYDGVLPSREAAPSDALWGRDSAQAIWVWLELPHVALAPGPVRVHVDVPGEAIRDVVVPAAGRRDAPRAVELPLWVDGDLHGMRQRFGDYASGAQLAERLLLSVANLGDTPRDVWIEERLRPARRHDLERTWPGKLAPAGDVVRTKVTIAPHKIERVAFTVAYEF